MEKGKTKTGIGAIDILAITFIVLGGFFTAFSIVIALNMSAFSANSSGNAGAVPIVFASIGVPFLALGIIFAVLSVHKRLVIKRVVDSGYYVMANVITVQQNFSVQVNGECPYIVECHYRDPSTGTLHIFKSRNLFFYPAELIGGQVRVYVDRENMKRYYMDVENAIQSMPAH